MQGSGELSVSVFVFKHNAPNLMLIKHVVLGNCSHFNELLYLSSGQAFYPVEHPVDVTFGDILAARCVFTGEGRTEATHIG